MFKKNKPSTITTESDANDILYCGNNDGQSHEYFLKVGDSEEQPFSKINYDDQSNIQIENNYAQELSTFIPITTSNYTSKLSDKKKRTKNKNDPPNQNFNNLTLHEYQVQQKDDSSDNEDFKNSNNDIEDSKRKTKLADVKTHRCSCIYEVAILSSICYLFIIAFFDFIFYFKTILSKYIGKSDINMFLYFGMGAALLCVVYSLVFMILNQEISKKKWAKVLMVIIESTQCLFIIINFYNKLNLFYFIYEIYQRKRTLASLFTEV